MDKHADFLWEILKGLLLVLLLFIYWAPLSNDWVSGDGVKWSLDLTDLAQLESPQEDVHEGFWMLTDVHWSFVMLSLVAIASTVIQWHCIVLKLSYQTELSDVIIPRLFRNTSVNDWVFGWGEFVVENHDPLEKQSKLIGQQRINIVDHIVCKIHFSKAYSEDS